MAKNIIVGVGGTGAKTVEAALVLMMSGMVEGDTYVGIVDQDLANGNVARTVNMLANLRKVQRLWSNTDHGIEWGEAGPQSIFNTNIRPLFADDDEIDVVYRPNTEGDTLHQMLGRGLDAPQEHLFDMLFLNDESEQKMKLNEGYRGRAHVGSAAFLASLNGTKNKFFEAIEDICQKSQGESINIFLVGSAFGGTGAAGFPTLARRLHNMRVPDDNGSAKLANASSVRIGGLLMLPYFMFDSPEDEEDVVVRPDELLPKTKLALEYYHKLLDLEDSDEGDNARTFDMFYTLGWNDPFPLGYHEPGANEQSNPALPAELVSATAAIDFFRKFNQLTEVEETRVHLSSRDDQAIDWGDLPIEAADQREYQARLGQLLRFCIYWRYIFAPELRQPLGGFMQKYNWAQKLAGKSHADQAADQMEALQDLIRSVQFWATSIEEMAKRSSTSQYLWRFGPFYRSNDEPTKPVLLANSIDEDTWAYGFDALIHNARDTVAGPPAAIILDNLVNASPQPKHSGIGKAVVSVYENCKIS
uniref:tubulin-like doman-containing protein n=1 Tax=Parerythrobacter lutipelagi TaxID=1964208 RepID=UPI0010F84E72|nr:tubulin-like doman-containing protein [Parerythrobacter lutipelagi]